MSEGVSIFPQTWSGPIPFFPSFSLPFPFLSFPSLPFSSFPKIQLGAVGSSAPDHSGEELTVVWSGPKVCREVHASGCQFLGNWSSVLIKTWFGLSTYSWFDLFGTDVVINWLTYHMIWQMANWKTLRLVTEGGGTVLLMFCADHPSIGLLFLDHPECSYFSPHCIPVLRHRHINMSACCCQWGTLWIKDNQWTLRSRHCWPRSGFLCTAWPQFSVTIGEVELVRRRIWCLLLWCCK